MRAFDTGRRDLQYPEWQGLLQEAILELDKDKFKARATAAETAIINRQQAILGNPDDRAERQALEDALSLLRVLKKDVLQLPG